MKFGGASLADGDKIAYAADVVKRFHDQGEQIAVVVSAISGVTDKLIEQAHRSSESDDTEQVETFASAMMQKHLDAMETAITDHSILEDNKTKLEDAVEDLKRTFIGICHLGELTSRSIDYVTSFGERSSAPIMAGALCSLGIDATSMTGGEAGIITDDKYNSAQPTEEVGKSIRDRVVPLLEAGQLPVITGFIGETEDGIITTLGRGGSDYTATIIGASIDADEVWMWKDVDGIMSTNPKIVPEAKTIHSISYIEAMEMSYFGADVLHPRAMKPVIENNVPVRVKNILKPDEAGTLIEKASNQTHEVVKAISYIDNVALINISGAGMVGTPGSAAKVFTALAQNDVNIMMISQGSSERNISLVIDRPHLDRATKALENAFDKKLMEDVTWRDDICALSVVGAGMAGIPGVSGRVFNALGTNHVNVIMISQGSSEYNISLVTGSDDARKAVKVLHEEFIEK